MNRPHRGSALLAALIVVGVLALVTVATFQIAALSKNQAARDSRTLSSTACVDTARQYLIGRLRVFGLDPTSITLNQAITVDSGTRTIFTGHARDSTQGLDGLMHPVGSIAVINTVMALPPGLVGNAGARNRDISNIVVASPTLGGRSYRVVVSCTDPTGADMELEFTFKYGL